MIPAKFKHQNCTYAVNQPEYLPLPAHKSEDGIVTTCWQLSFIERLMVLMTGRLWWQSMTFNNSLQPQKPSIKNPIKQGEIK